MNATASDITPQTIAADATPVGFASPAEAELFRYLEGDAELWLLSRRAIGNYQVRAIIQSCDSWQVPAVLRATSAGRAFLGDLDWYDERHGRRSAASWTEDPTPMIESLRELMARPDSDAPV